jgi:hypothetical protein
MVEMLRKSLCDCDTWMKEKGLTVPEWIELGMYCKVKPLAVLGSGNSSPTSCRGSLLCFRTDGKQNDTRVGLSPLRRPFSVIPAKHCIHSPLISEMNKVFNKGPSS